MSKVYDDQEDLLEQIAGNTIDVETAIGKTNELLGKILGVLEPEKREGHYKNFTRLELDNRVMLLEKEVDDSHRRIRYALDHCPVCSPKPGTPQLCPTCVMLQAGYVPGSKEEYEAYLKR